MISLSKQGIDIGNVVYELLHRDEFSLALNEIALSSIYSIDNVAFNLQVENGTVIMRLVGAYEKL